MLALSRFMHVGSFAHALSFKLVLCVAGLVRGRSFARVVFARTYVLLVCAHARAPLLVASLLSIFFLFSLAPLALFSKHAPNQRVLAYLFSCMSTTTWRIGGSATATAAHAATTTTSAAASARRDFIAADNGGD